MNLNLGPVAIRGQSILREESTLSAERHLKSFPLTHPPNLTSEANASNYRRTVLQTSEDFLGGCTHVADTAVSARSLGLGLSHTIARANAFNV